MAIRIKYWKTRGNNLKSLALFFQVVIHFHPSHPQSKTLVSCFRALIQQLHVNKIGPLFLGFPRHIYILAVKKSVKIRDKVL